MLSFLIQLWSIEKSYIVPFKKKSFGSSFVKSFGSIPKEKLYLLKLSLALNLQISVF